jgi:hypothetical protein
MIHVSNSPTASLWRWGQKRKSAPSSPTRLESTAWEETHFHRHLGHGEIVSSSYKVGIDPESLRVVVNGELRFVVVGERSAESVEEERVLEVELGADKSRRR